MDPLPCTCTDPLRLSHPQIHTTAVRILITVSKRQGSSRNHRVSYHKYTDLIHHLLLPQMYTHPRRNFFSSEIVVRTVSASDCMSSGFMIHVISRLLIHFYPSALTPFFLTHPDLHRSAHCMLQLRRVLTDETADTPPFHSRLGILTHLRLGKSVIEYVWALPSLFGRSCFRALRTHTHCQRDKGTNPSGISSSQEAVNMARRSMVRNRNKQ